MHPIVRHRPHAPWRIPALPAWTRWLLTLLLFVTAIDASAAVNAWFDRDTVTLGETVTLNVEVDGVLGRQPDLSALASDFRVVGNSSSTNVSIVNGQRRATTLWAVALEPQREGSLTVPALDVAGERTAALTLTVLPAPQGASGQPGDDAFLEVEASPLDPYVQQQVRYTVRLFYAVPLLEGQLDEPQADGARLQRIGNDVSFQRVIGDRRYQVVERTYALAAERSGTLQIPAPQFRGRSAGGGYFGGGGVLGARGDAVTLQVRPRPASAPQPWLPAQELSLDDESELPAQARVGEPLTLSLRLSALGLMAEQLPELQLPPIDGAQVYPDRESSQTLQVDTNMRGERVRKFAVVPSRDGPLQLPAVRIGWWNTTTDRLEYAELPARTIDVLPATAAAGEPPAAVREADAGIDAADAASGDPAPAGDPARPWQWLSALFAVLWLATLAWRRRPLQIPAAEAGKTPRGGVHAAPRSTALPAALAAGDPAAIASALRHAAPGGPLPGLEDVAGRLADTAQAEAVRALERALYAGGDADAAVAGLRRVLAAGPRWAQDRPHAQDDDSLPPLYR